MGQLSNVPAHLTLRLEARKSFSLGLLVQNASGHALDITDTDFTFTANSPRHLGGTQVLDLAFEILSAEDGLARVNFQAADLDLAAAEYSFTVTMITSEGYSAAIAKGGLIIEDNTESAAVAETYSGLGVSNGITVLLGESQQIVLRVDHIGYVIPANTVVLDGGEL